MALQPECQSLHGSGGARGAAPSPLRVGILLARDFTLSAFATFVDTLRLASDIGDRSRQVNCRWSVLSATGRPVRSSAGLSLVPSAPLEAPTAFDYIAVVGGLLRDEYPVDAATIAFLRQAAHAKIPLIGLCTGTFILAGADLLAGRPVCVSWFHLDEFRDRFPDLDATADRLFVDSGDRLTCSGGVSSADLAAYLVEKHLGLKLKTKAMEVLQIDRARAGTDPQARKLASPEAADPRVRRALLIMEQNIEEPLPIPQIAKRLGITARTLERLFLRASGLTPSQAYTKLRLEAARDLLRDSTRPIIDVALATGFPEPSYFTRLFRQQFGSTPSSVRGQERDAAPSP